MVPPDRLEVERRRSPLWVDVRQAAGGGMLDAVLKVLTEGERRECWPWPPGWS
jgi:hypothetical protein